jgi:hypothetical protein
VFDDLPVWTVMSFLEFGLILLPEKSLCYESAYPAKFHRNGVWKVDTFALWKLIVVALLQSLYRLVFVPSYDLIPLRTVPSTF